MADIKKIALPDGTSYDIGNLIEISLTWSNNIGTLRDYTNWGDIVNGTHIAGQSTIYFFRYVVGGKSLILFSTSYTSGEFDTIFYSQPDENGYIYKGTVQRSGNTVTINSYTIYPVPGDNGTIQSGDVLTATVLVNPISGNRSFSYNWQTPQSGGVSKVKIYYVLSSSQFGYWSGQDYSNYNFSFATIYEENDNTSDNISTNEIYTEISNGILVILRVLDPNDCPVYCFPSVVGDDASWMNFSATYTTSDDVLVTLNLTMNIDEYSNCDGYYSLPSGGGSDLPSVTSSDYNKYLHTNASTGALEWSTISSQLPSVSSSDNGKFLRVVNGAWAAATVPDANGVSF